MFNPEKSCNPVYNSNWKKPMKKFISFLVFVGCATSILAAVPADFATTRAIQGVPLAAPRLVQVRLDAPIFAATRPELPDLRLFDGADQELPRLIEPLYTTKERRTRHSVAARATALQELPDNRIEAHFELATNALSPAGIDIRTPLRDFIRTVRIQGSTDGQSWETLVDDAQIYDYARYMDIRRTEIPLPPNECRHFILEIGNASEERAQPLIRLVQANGQDQSRAFDLLQTPFRIDGVSFWREETVLAQDELVLQDWPPTDIIVTQDPKVQTTEIVIQTGSAPITRLELETTARNFRRTALVQIPVLSHGQLTWRTISEGAFTRIDVSGLATNAMAINFPEQRAAEIRLVLQNHDNPPLDVIAVRPSGPVYRLLWLADPAAASYCLAYGNEKLPAPTYDLYAIRAALAQNIPAEQWELAASVASDPSSKPFDFGEFLSRPLVFGTALGLAALALLGLLVKALQKAA